MATKPSSATMRLIELAEHLTPSGEIGDGLVAQFHEAATLARLEQLDRDAFLAGAFAMHPNLDLDAAHGGYGAS